MKKIPSHHSSSTREAASTGWLVRDNTVLASISCAQSRRARRVGLRGTDRVSTPLLLQPCRWVHSFGMRVPLAVLYINHGGEVVKIQELKILRKTKNLATPMFHRLKFHLYRRLVQ